MTLRNATVRILLVVVLSLTAWGLIRWFAPRGAHGVERAFGAGMLRVTSLSGGANVTAEADAAVFLLRSPRAALLALDDPEMKDLGKTAGDVGWFLESTKARRKFGDSGIVEVSFKAGDEKTRTRCTNAIMRATVKLFEELQAQRYAPQADNKEQEQAAIKELQRRSDTLSQEGNNQQRAQAMVAEIGSLRQQLRQARLVSAMMESAVKAGDSTMNIVTPALGVAQLSVSAASLRQAQDQEKRLESLIAAAQRDLVEVTTQESLSRALERDLGSMRQRMSASPVAAPEYRIAVLQWASAPPLR